MGVLPAVLTDARHITFDVAGIVSCLIEGRREELHEPILPIDQPLLYRVHGLACALFAAGAGEHGPRLGD